MTVINMANVTGPYSPPSPPANPLAARVDHLQNVVKGHQDMIKDYEETWFRLGEYLIEKADDHDLCSVFDDAVDRWNRDHPNHQLPTRTVELDIEIRVNVYGTFKRGTDESDLVETISDLLQGADQTIDRDHEADSYVRVFT